MCYLSIFCAVAPLAAILGFVVADSPRIRRGRTSNPLTIAIVTGALWPLRLVGAAQLIAIMGVGRVLRPRVRPAQLIGLNRAL